MKQFYFPLLFLFFGQMATANNEEAYACPVVGQNLQIFCEKPGPTIASLVATDQGGGVAWFSTATSTTALAAGTPLVHGSNYYAGAADGSCSSGRPVVTVEIADAPNAGSNMNLTFSSDDPPIDLFSLIGSNAYGPPDAGGVMDPPLRSGTTLFDPSLDGAYTGRRRYRYTVASGNNICSSSTASIYVTINPQGNSSHRLIHYGDTEEEAYYNQNNYTPASSDEGILFNIWGTGPLEVGSVYKIEMNGLERYYYVNNVYSAPELSPMYILPADTPIEKFIVTDPNGIGREAYSAPVLSNENYVYSRSPQIPVVDMDALKYTDEVIENITYFDGLGRGKQAIAIRAGGDGEDVITPMEYDQFGRTAREFLPYARKTLAGEMHPEVIEAERIYGPTIPYINFYQTIKYDFTVNPYSEKEFEASPLNRVLKQAAPGEAWKLGGGHEIEFAYQANTQNEVRLFKVDFINEDPSSPVLAIAAEEFYGAGQLYKTITRDENHSGNTKNHTTEEFKDKQGRIVLKRTYADMENKLQEPHDTYYVYDDYSNLTFVLPPKMDASDPNTDITNILNNLAAFGYQYKYDHRNRLIEKKIPGKGWEYIIYNGLDQPILTQDALLREDSKWLYTKYDAFGRVTSTGIYTDPVNSQTQADMQAIVDNFYGSTTPPKQYEEKSGSIYTNRSFPTTGTEILTENFYDTYNFASAGLVVPEFNQYGKEVRTDRTKGLATGTRVKVLETANWITTVINYDKEGRAIWTASKNEFLGTDDFSHSDLDFVGKLRAQTNIHIKEGQTITTEDLYSYDHMGRQLSHTQSINGGGSSELIARNKYDELGVLIRKSVGGSVSNQNSIPVAVTTQFDELVHMEVRENGEIYKISGGTSETGIAKTTETFTGDGYVEFSPQASDKLFSVGLSYVDPNNPDYQYNYFADVNRNFMKINEGGANLEYAMDYQVDVAPGDRITVEREGSAVLYKKNGETFYISSIPSYGEVRAEARVRNTGAIMHYMRIVDLEENEKPLQTINYAYNVRGWLKKINEPENLGNDHFGFEINYNDPRDQATTKLFNGNISETHWNTKSENNTNNPVSNQYSYSYDALNRITGAMDNTGNYNLGDIKYDKMGNILSLQRQGFLENNITPFGPMDALSYTYDGNQLVQVADASNRPEGFKDGYSGVDYAYDDNGNLTFDANKGIGTSTIPGIKYNPLNLPTEVMFNNTTSQVIKYTYDATGLKLRKEIPGKITDYAGNFIYEGGTLQFFNHPEGYVSYDGGQFNYVYNYKDHLGNIRLNYSDGNGNGTIENGSTYSEIIQEKNYYPFGLTHEGYNGGGSGLGNDAAKRYGFGGKELQSESVSGSILDWYDVSARNYDPAMGRWMNLDPLAEQMRRHSPYVYAFNNPVFFQDPDGLSPACSTCPLPAELKNFGNYLSNKIDSGMRDLAEGIKSAGEVLVAPLLKVNNYLNEGGGGFNFFSESGDNGDPGRKGDRNTEMVNADGIFQAARIGKTNTIQGPKRNPEDYVEVLENTFTITGNTIEGLELGGEVMEVITIFKFVRVNQGDAHNKTSLTLIKKDTAVFESEAQQREEANRREMDSIINANGIK